MALCSQPRSYIFSLFLLLLIKCSGVCKVMGDQEVERAVVTTPKDFIDAVVQHHNEYRASHNSPPLTLKDDLCKIAQGLANACAAKGKMEHFPVDSIYGQNIHKATNDPDAKAVLDKWYSEIEKFDWKHHDGQAGTGHFTQLVWKESTEVGVAKAYNSKHGWFTACVYLPNGNHMGEFRENVHQKK